MIQKLLDKWYLQKNGVKIAGILSFLPATEGNKIVSRLYDGTYHVQTIGTPAECADINIVVTSQDMLRVVNAAEAAGDILIAHYKGVDYAGYIENRVSWQHIARGQVYTGSLRFLGAVSE